MARIAGIQAGKKTSDLIPLCHPLPLTHLDVSIEVTDTGARIEHPDDVNDIVGAWFAAHDFDEVMSVMDDNDVPVGPVNTMREVAADEQLRERESLIDFDVAGLGSVLMPGLVPKFSETPGRIAHGGPRLGEHDGQPLGWPELDPEVQR